MDEYKLINNYSFIYIGKSNQNIFNFNFKSNLLFQIILFLFLLVPLELVSIS